MLRRLILGLALILGLVTGGCGTESGDTEDSPETTTTAPAETTTTEQAGPDCDELRDDLKDAKTERTSNGFDNPEEEAEMKDVDDKARAARQAGCDIDDLVGPNVGA